MSSSNSSPSPNIITPSIPEKFQIVHLSCPLCLMVNKERLILIDPNRQKLFFKKPTIDTYIFKVFHDGDGHIHSLIIDFKKRDSLIMYNSILKWQEEEVFQKGFLSPTIDQDILIEKDRKLLDTTIRYESEIKKLENRVRLLNDEKEYDNQKYSKMIKERDQNIIELNKSFLAKIKQIKDSYTELETKNTSLELELNELKINVSKDNNMTELTNELQKKAKAMKELSTKYKSLKKQYNTQIKEKNKTIDLKVLTVELQRDLYLAELELLKGKNNPTDYSTNDFIFNSENTVSGIKSTITKYLELKSDIFDIMGSVELPSSFQDAFQFIYAELLLWSERTISSILSKEFQFSNMEGINSKLSYFNLSDKYTKEQIQASFELYGVLFVFKKLLPPIKVFTRKLISLFSDKVSHTIVPYDATVLGTIKGTRGKTNYLYFTIEKNLIPEDIFSWLDTDTVRILKQKSSFLCTDNYLLVVPSSFEARNGDWEVFDTKLKINVKTVKLTIRDPCIFDFNDSNSDFVFGYYENKNYFSISPKI